MWSRLQAPGSVKAWVPEFSLVQLTGPFGVGCSLAVKALKGSNALWVVGQKFISADKIFNNDTIYKEYNHNEENVLMAMVTKPKAVKQQAPIHAAQRSNPATTAAVVQPQQQFWLKRQPLSLLWLPPLRLYPSLQHQGFHLLNMHLLLKLNKRNLHKSQWGHLWLLAHYPLTAHWKSLSKKPFWRCREHLWQVGLMRIW